MRFIYALLVMFFSLVVPWWLVVPLWVGYALLGTTYELIVLGVLLDAYLSAGAPYPLYYTITAFVIVLGMLWLKPRMSFFRTE